MPLLPESLRQQLAPVVKYHFWILAALVPLLLVPALFMADGQLKAKIDRERATIDSHVSSLTAVRGEPDHPNDAWAAALDAQAAAARDELLREWRILWDSQQPLRLWPAELGPDFLASIQAVESGGRRDLQFRDLQRYQNTVPDLVRELPQRMGCEEMMVGVDGEPKRGLPSGGGQRGEDDSPEASQQLSPLEWKPEDQKRLFASFVWKGAPTTTQVVLAQEELWVYGLLCDAISRMNQGAKGAFDASITMVDELAVGYLAAEEKPGGRGTGRIIGLREIAAGSGMDDGLPPEPGSESASDDIGARPPHPRFSGGGFVGEGLDSPSGGGVGSPASGGTAEEGDSPQLSSEDLFKQWIYVDFEGKPLTAPKLATAPDAQLVHLMPFVLRVIVDQRQIDRLLAVLASSQIPIDVRQVRINPSSQAAGAGGFAAQGSIGNNSSAPGDRRQRPFDVTLELRGTVGLATPPNPATLGAAAAGDQTAGDGGGS